MAESTTTAPRKTRAAKPPTVEAAIEALSAALADPESDDHAAAVEYVEEHFKQLAESAGDETAEGHPTVYRAILAVMRNVLYVGKNGTNDDQNYSFRGIDDVMNALGPAMRRHGLLMFPKLVRKDVERWERQNQYGKKSFSTAVAVEVEYRFVNAFGENGDETTVYVPGESIDTSDKGTAKAMSVALRTAMLQTFALPTYAEDPDQKSPEVVLPEPISAEELRNAAKYAATNFEDLDEGFAALREHYGSARIAASKGVTAEGEEVSAEDYLVYAQAQWAAHRAKLEAEQQDGDAQGKTSEQSEGDEPAEQDWRRNTKKAATEPEQTAPRTQPDETQPDETQPGAAAPQQEQRQAPEPGKTRQQTQKERLLTWPKEELIFQAGVINVSPAELGASILDEPGNLDSINSIKAGRFLIGQRPRVIHLLRERGDATVAEAYERVGQGFPANVSYFTDQQ